MVSNIWKPIRPDSRVKWLLGVVCLAASAQTPSLTFDKHQFFPDESVRFWIGVSSPEDIPESLWQSGVEHITRPDGSKVDRRTPWPMDGDARRGFGGGSGLGAGPHLLGSYRISFEFAGKKTEDQIIEILPNPFEGRVQAFWIYHSHRAVLRVENHSGRMVRFAEPGLIGPSLMGGEVSISVRHEGSLQESLIPESAISPPHITPRYSFDSLNWSNLARWPMVEVPPGQAVERTVALIAAFPFREKAEYDVTLGLTLTLFIGESSDIEAPLFPERRIVSSDTRFRW